MNQQRFLAEKFKAAGVATVALTFVFATFLIAQTADPWPAKDVLQPAELARILKGPGPKPLILQVGFETLYNQAHIPGSPYCGAARNSKGIEHLRSCLAKVPKTRAIVLYCGCCPWAECPNIRPAYRAVKALGYRDVKVLYIASNLGKDWVYRGFPTAH